MGSAEETFMRITGELEVPMLIVTTIAGDERAGCLVGFSTQCSIDPPRYLVCLSDKNQTTRVAGAASALAVHFVPESARDLAELFGSETDDEVDKFARCDWQPGPLELPLLTGGGRWFAGRILDRRRFGDHIAHLLAPFAASAAADGNILRFSQVKEMEPGHEA